MVYDLQKAGLWKRIAAWMFDGILTGILAVGFGFVLSLVLGYNGYSQAVDEAYAKYEAQYGIAFEITQEAYESMTDAQRLGYLYFHNDAVAESIASSQAPAVVTGMQPILQKELLRHIRVYNPYAMAQAFDIPYEKALSLRDYDRKKLFFNEDFIAYIDNSSSKELAETLPQHIEKVQQELAALRHTTPNPENLDFYVNYYRLSAKAGFLQSLLSVAKTNLKYNIKP